MFSKFDDIIFSIVLVFPIVLFYLLAKKQWIDKDLKNAFWSGIIAGTGAFLLVRLLYIPLEVHLGGDIRNFIVSPRKWYIILIACIGIVGFIEEGVKAMASHLVCCLNKTDGFRPTYVFMSFAGCSLSFAFIENVIYYMIYGSSVVLPRVFICSIAHFSFSCFCSYFSAMAFSTHKSAIKVVLLLNLGVIISAVFHGTLDFIILKTSFISLSGITLFLLSILLYLSYEIWVKALKYDIPPIGFLAVCSNCRALTVDRIRFCPFCGNRVKKIDSLPDIVNESIK